MGLFGSLLKSIGDLFSSDNNSSGSYSSSGSGISIGTVTQNSDSKNNTSSATSELVVKENVIISTNTQATTQNTVSTPQEVSCPVNFDKSKVKRLSKSAINDLNIARNNLYSAKDLLEGINHSTRTALNMQKCLNVINARIKDCNDAINYLNKVK